MGMAVPGPGSLGGPVRDASPRLSRHLVSDAEKSRCLSEIRMDERELGRTGLRVPVVGMGTWRTFDVRGAAAESRCREIVDVALANGARLFDSSPMYGAAERVLARALEGRRERAIVATKVWSTDLSEGRRQI